MVDTVVGPRDKGEIDPEKKLEPNLPSVLVADTPGGDPREPAPRSQVAERRDLAVMADADAQAAQTWILLGGFAISVVFAAHMLVTHAEPHSWHDPEERWVLGVCFAAYLISWVPLWLLPLDMVGMVPNTRCDVLDDSLHWMQAVWTLVWALNLVAGYVTNDFARTYTWTGGFTVRRRAWLAWVGVRNFYRLWSIVGVALLIPIAWNLGFFTLASAPRAPRPWPTPRPPVRAPRPWPEALATHPGPEPRALAPGPEPSPLCAQRGAYSTRCSTRWPTRTACSSSSGCSPTRSWRCPSGCGTCRSARSSCGTRASSAAR